MIKVTYEKRWRKIAKVKGPLFSINAIGKIDNKLIYRDSKVGPEVKKYTRTINPNTAGQQDQKGFFRNAINAWSIDGYTVADKWGWDQYAKTRKVITSGFNCFSGLRMRSEREGNTWNKLTNVIIYDVTFAGFKVDVNVVSDLEGVLYLGTSKYSMLQEFPGVFNTNKYTFTVTGIPDETKVYFYIKNTSVGESARTGIFNHYHVGGWAPSPIDIGALAINRAGWGGMGNTQIFQDNPADGTGKITSIEVFAVSGYNLVGLKVATFFVVSGNTLSTRDWANIGAVTSGSKQTFVVDINVVAGDFIGLYASSGRIERENTNGTGESQWKDYGDFIPCTNRNFTLSGGGVYKMKHSIHGKGETVE